MEDKGYVQVYTGSAKGKTTAALGLTLRAAGAGYRIFLGQFLKQEQYSEHKTLRVLGDRVTVRAWGGDRAIGQKLTDEDMRLGRKGLEELRSALTSGEYDVVIADEINVAVHLGLLSEEEVLELIRQKPENVEFVLTGRYATDRIIEAADLVTEMVVNKHYYSRGVKARKGVEK
jgi:cob(I)alamin adenosyltransferase